MIRAVIFDAGDTFLKGDFLGFVEKSCEIIGVDYLSNKEAYKTRYFNLQFHLGEKDHISVFEEFFEKKLSHKQKNLLLEFYDNAYKPDLQMRKLAEKLKKHYLIAILSNSDSRYEALADENGWYDIFDAVFYSHKLHMAKPDKRIYLYAAETLNVLSGECLFIDNNPEFVIGAKKAGMDAIHYTSYLELIGELKKKGVLF